MINGRPATLLDVAKVANVSAKTVSRVIHADPHISPETELRVRQAIAQLDYQPNLAARSLRSQRDLTLCLPTFYFHAEYFAEVVRGAAHECSIRGRHLAIEELTLDQPPAAKVCALIDRTRFDGILLIPPLADDLDLIASLDERRMPCVRLSPTVELERTAYVAAADAHGVNEMVQHLWTMGHRRFGLAVGPAAHGSAHVRRDSFVAAVSRLGGAEGSVSVYEIPSSLAEDLSFGHRGAMLTIGASALDSFLDQPAPPTAVFAFSDEMASGIVNRAHMLGVRVPDDMAVAGFDDFYISQLVFPALTTIRQPVTEMAALATSFLIDRKPPEASITLPVQLVVRQSTAGAGTDRTQGL